MAVAHQLLTIIFHIVRDGTVYQELGASHYDRQNKPKITRKLVDRLQRLGYYVTLRPIEELSETVPSSAAAMPVSSPEDAKPRQRRRGRPCKCAERGIECKHGRSSPSIINTSKNPDQAQGADTVSP